MLLLLLLIIIMIMIIMIITIIMNIIMNIMILISRKSGLVASSLAEWAGSGLGIPGIRVFSEGRQRVIASGLSISFR